MNPLHNKDVAKIIRKCLKEAFPTTKFSVRAPRRDGIVISWTDGPTELQVDAVVSRFQGYGFDSMEDYKYKIYHAFNGEPITIYADYIFTDRVISDEFYNKRLSLHKFGETFNEWDIQQFVYGECRKISKEMTQESATAAQYVVTGSEYEEREKARAKAQKLKDAERKKTAELERQALEASFVCKGQAAVSMILVEFSESSAFENGKVYEYAEFERIAKEISQHDVGYYKTKVIATFEDGEQYGCRIDLGPSNESGFADHMRKVVSFYNSETEQAENARKMQSESYLTFIDNFRNAYTLDTPQSNVVSLYH